VGNYYRIFIITLIKHSSTIIVNTEVIYSKTFFKALNRILIMVNPPTPSQIKQSLALSVEKYVEEIFATKPEGIIINDFNETVVNTIENPIEGFQITGEIIFPLINNKNKKLKLGFRGFVSNRIVELQFNPFGMLFILDNKGNINQIYPIDYP